MFAGTGQRLVQVESVFFFADLPLRSVKHQSEVIVAKQQRYVLEVVLAVNRPWSVTDERVVAIEFHFPAW